MNAPVAVLNSSLREMGERGKRQRFLDFLIDYLERSSFHGVWHLTRIRRNHPIET